MTADAPASTVDVDEFRLLRVLGKGGMGSVYLGYDTVLERDVAIKLLRDDPADDGARRRFLTEARAIARLDHPNVVAIFRASTTAAGHPYLVQELVRGRSLDHIALPVAPARALAIGLGIVRGLAAAHRRGILHRDIKPANVMLDDDDTPKLLDFGVAKLTGRGLVERGRASPSEPPLELDRTARAPSAAVAETSDPRSRDTPRAEAAPAAAPPLTGPAPATEAGTIIGTPRYMAPEIWRGEPATVRSDLYSFGALLYELVAGTSPYAHADRAGLQAAVLAGPPPRAVTEFAPALDGELAELIMACLARDPARRPGSADEIAHRIERIVLGAPPVPDGNPYPGLASFSEQYRAVFYGRGTEISAVVDRLRSAPLVVVAGDSGIGKSSLCRAGVIPAVLAGALGDHRTWRARTLSVGRRAVAGLRDALALADAPPELSPGEVVRATGVSNDTGLVLFIDQLEQLVTLNDSGEAAEAAAIIASLARGVPGLKILIAVRGDFLTRVAALPELGSLITRELHLLRVLSPADARDAVVGPARAKGVRFATDALVDVLAASVAGQPGSLPLLSFALAELWQRRDVERAVIPAAALDEIGGVAGALARHADAVIGALGHPERIAARRIALLLVTDDGTRAERDRRELCPDEDPAAVVALEAMIRGRLVAARNTASGEPSYQLAHDSLIAAWSTLRGWRDDVAGQRGLRIRIAAAAHEWRRLGRARAALWNRAQLAEAARLDELSAGDRVFLAASRAAARRRRFAAIALAASLPAVAIATWLAIQQRDRAERDREIAAHLTSASRHLASATASREPAARDRDEAFRLFDANAKSRAEPLWAHVRARLAETRAAYAAAVVELEAAMLIDGSRDDVRDRTASALHDQAVLAEEMHDHGAARELVARLAAFDREGKLGAAWRRLAPLSIDAPGAVRIDVRAYRDRAGRLELGAPVASAASHRLTAALPIGSYLAELRGSDGVLVRYPFVVSRGESPALAVAMPRAAAIPAGMVYVPPGEFLVGTNTPDDRLRGFLGAAPLHTVTTRAYFIAAHEVTFAAWMDYLRALPPAEREARRPRAGDVKSGSSESISLTGGIAGQPFVLAYQPARQRYEAGEGRPLVYPGRTRRREVRWEAMPVNGISFEDVRAYAAWLASTDRMPGARLCTSLEWERAARGADGRLWASGDQLAPDDANLDVTYGQRELAFGPDEVGAHPGSTSPFGVADTAGNVWEWVEGPAGAASLRGGSGSQGATSALAANREEDVPATKRSPWFGARLCADAPSLR